MTMWNQTIPDALRGRLAGIEMVGYMSGPLLGHVEAGAVAALAGVQASSSRAALLCVLGVVACGPLPCPASGATMPGRTLRRHADSKRTAPPARPDRPTPRDRGRSSRASTARTPGATPSRLGAGLDADRTAAFVDDLVAALRPARCAESPRRPVRRLQLGGARGRRGRSVIGADVVPELVAANQARHASPRRAFLRLDLTRDALPAADAVLCRDCLVHFSFAGV